MQSMLAWGAGLAGQGNEQLSVVLWREGVVDGAWAGHWCYFSSSDRAGNETQSRQMESSLMWRGKTPEKATDRKSVA